jgi:hypothetical protein
MINKSFVTMLHHSHEFRTVHAELIKLRPVIPVYNPDADNIEKMKFESARQQMFDTILTLISLPKGVSSENFSTIGLGD